VTYITVPIPVGDPFALPGGAPRGGRELSCSTAQRTGRAEPETSSLGSYRISHSTVINWFKKYLNTTKGLFFWLTGTCADGQIVKKLPYINRWTPIYQKSKLAKFYKLDEWLKEHPEKGREATMLTLTVYQTTKSELNDGSYSRNIKGHDLTYEESLDLLLTSREKLLNVLRNRYPGLNYVWVLEAHETGNAHCHLLIFKGLTETEQNSIKELWSCKYQAGSSKHGVKISESKNVGEILSMKNYLMKYMNKQFGVGAEEWTDGDLLFNAMMWKTGTRMWGASKEITAVMRKPESISDVVWDTVELIVPGKPFGSFVHLIWSRENGEPFPAHGAEQDPDDLAPEGQITKMRWQVMYWAERIWREQCQAQTEWSKGAWRHVT